MSNWGISPNASEKEKIKADYADILHGMNSTGAIPYDVYSDLFDDGMELFDRMYAQGKADAVPVAEIKDYLQKRLDEWEALGDRKFEPANMWGYNFIMACFDDLERRDGGS